MSLYPTGVCVVTTQVEKQSPFALTVNSLTSLSLEPPMVLWNLQKSSDNYKEWREADYFAVNVLRADQAHLAKRFALKGRHVFEKAELVEGKTGCPVLADCRATLECKIYARYEEGDHAIIIGAVTNVVADPDAAPLIFYKGTYGTVEGTVI